MHIGHKVESLYKDYTVEMARLESHLGAVRGLGLNGISTIGPALDEISVTGVAKEFLHRSNNVIDLGSGFVIKRGRLLD